MPPSRTPGPILPVADPPQPTSWQRRANHLRALAAAAGLLLAVLVSPSVRAAAGSGGGDPAALWGLLPIGLYAVLAISGMSILAATLVAIAAAVLLDVPTVFALLTLVIGMLWVPVVQRRSARAGDFYTAEEAAETSAPLTDSARTATLVFTSLLVVLVVVAIVTGVGLVFPLIALPLLAIATGIAARLSLREWLAAMGRGTWSMAGTFVLFWLLAVLFLIIDRLQPFDTVLALLGPQLESSSPFVFTMIVALIGWVGVPGATAAQVVLIDRVFGPLAAEIGVSAGSWVVVLLFASKADTYGPFPNPNMVTSMGLAHSKNLQTMLLTGWILLVPAAVMYTAILFVETR